MIYTNLSKQWWDELRAINQESVDRFCKWIDEYKANNGWTGLFNEYEDEYGVMVYAPKFHDLPLAMQIGILTEYFGWEMSTGFNPTEAEADAWALHRDSSDVMHAFIWMIHWLFVNNVIPQRELS